MDFWFGTSVSCWQALWVETSNRWQDLQGWRTGALEAGRGGTGHGVTLDSQAQGERPLERATGKQEYLGNLQRHRPRSKPGNQCEVSQGWGAGPVCGTQCSKRRKSLRVSGFGWAPGSINECNFQWEWDRRQGTGLRELGSTCSGRDDSA